MRIVKLLQLIPYRFFYLLGLAVFTIGLPFNNLMMSQGLFIVAGTWLLNGVAFHNFRSKFNAFFSNKQALALSAVLVALLISLLYSESTGFGLRDLRIKLPLFLLPFIVTGLGPLKEKEYKGLLLLFIAAVAASTIWGYLLCISRYGNSYEPRQLSPFISHIRLSLLIIIALFTAGWLALQQRSVPMLIAKVALTAWFLFFMYKLESLTGFSILFITAITVLIINLKAIKSKALRFALPTVLALLVIGLGYNIYIAYKSYFTLQPGEEKEEQAFTKNGSPYDDVVGRAMFIENGNYVFGHVNHKELAEEWPKRSNISLDSTDRKGQPIYYTLLRYMTSKHLHKNAQGIHALSNADIGNIENGIANLEYLNNRGFTARLNKIFWEYQVYKVYKNPGGHSVFMRLEFWRTATGIIAEHPLIGVGTGDVPEAFTEQYKKNNCQMEGKWRLRSHNQFLAIAVATGLIGLAIFLFSMFYPYLSAKGYNSVLFTAFFVTAFLSMLTEDTLETQAGVSFYIYFFCLFLFLKPGIKKGPTLTWGPLLSKYD